MALGRMSAVARSVVRQQARSSGSVRRARFYTRSGDATVIPSSQVSDLTRFARALHTSKQNLQQSAAASAPKSVPLSKLTDNFLDGTSSVYLEELQRAWEVDQLSFLDQGTEPHKRDKEVAYASVYDVDHLRAAYEKLHRTVAPGIDGRAQTELTERGFLRLSEELRRQRYAPKPAQRVILPTPDGGRPLSIASTIDKLVQTAVVMVIEPAFEATFRDSSHGFRIGRSCHGCLKVLRSTWLGMTWLVSIDLQKLFTKAHHDILLDLMAPVLQSKSMEDLLRKLLNAGYVDVYNLTDRTQYNTELVMGSVISPLCNNILLHQLDCYVEDELIPMFGAGALSAEGGGEEGPKRLKYLRYADNILFGLKGSKQDGVAVRHAVQTFLQQKLKFDINEHSSPVSNARSEMTKFLGALIQYN